MQTVRFALPPFAPVVGGDAARVVPLALQLEEACAAHAIDYATIGPALPQDDGDLAGAIPEAIAATGRNLRVGGDRRQELRASACRPSGTPPG